MTQQRKKNRNVEVYNPYKQLQNEGFDFYNFNSNDIPKYYTVRLNDTDKLISKKLKWRKKKKKKKKKHIKRVLETWMQSFIMTEFLMSIFYLIPDMLMF